MWTCWRTSCGSNTFFHVEMRRKILYISVCTDGAGFFNRGNQSWGPYTGVCFNLPPWLRNKFGLLFLFGVMPSQIKNYSSTCTAHVFLVCTHITQDWSRPFWQGAPRTCGNLLNADRGCWCGTRSPTSTCASGLSSYALLRMGQVSRSLSFVTNNPRKLVPLPPHITIV